MADENDQNDTTQAPPAPTGTNASATILGHPHTVNLTEAEIAAREAADISAAPVALVEASGAIMEKGARAAIDVKHPAVDNNPRADTTIAQNQIDFNDPGLTVDEAVAANLKAAR